MRPTNSDSLPSHQVTTNKNFSGPHSEDWTDRQREREREREREKGRKGRIITGVASDEYFTILVGLRGENTTG